MAKIKNKAWEEGTKTLKIFSPKQGKMITIEIYPKKLPRQFYECLGCSNSDYGG